MEQNESFVSELGSLLFEETSNSFYVNSVGSSWALSEPNATLGMDAFIAEHSIMADERQNFNVDEMFSFWIERYVEQKKPQSRFVEKLKTLPPIRYQAWNLLEPHQKSKISIDDLDSDYCDFQGINWVRLGVTKDEARYVRKLTYRNHTNVLSSGDQSAIDHNQKMLARAKALPEFASYFRFFQMNRSFMTRQIHFQLRHMISASSRNAVFLACGNKIQCANPRTDAQQCVLDFSKPCNAPDIPPMRKVSTLKANHDVLIVGGFEGEYAMKSLLVGADSAYTSGTITKHENSSTNHVHTFLGRRNGLPQAVFSNNDSHVRVLDCHTNQFIRDHDCGWAVNCSATSPDSRLRLIVGDHCSPWVTDAETGSRIAELPNHTDFGFACAWSQNGVHMATGNQDQIVQIWDARNWKEAIHVLATNLAGVRTLEFSPLGGGKPVLALAEPADYVSIVDADSYQDRQLFSFLGEIGGISFTPDGSSLFVANTDNQYGGLSEFDRVRDSQRYARCKPQSRRDSDDIYNWLNCAKDERGNQSSAELGDEKDYRGCETSFDPPVMHTGAYHTNRGLEIGHLLI